MYLISDKPHDSNPRENVLSADCLLGHLVAVGGGLGVVRLTKVTHEHIHVRTATKQSLNTRMVQYCKVYTMYMKWHCNFSIMDAIASDTSNSSLKTTIIESL